MNKCIALLRGVNVSGKNKIKMVELKSALSMAGLQNVQTYIQSGNILFESNLSNDEAAQLISKIIKGKFGYDVPSLVVAQEMMKTVMASNPFIHKVDDEKKLYVCFLFDQPDEEGLQRLADTDTKGDEYIINGSILYACYHHGMGKSKMDNGFIEAKLKVTATIRNWRTVGMLAS